LIFAIVRTGLTALRRDRGALALSFILPLAFFTIFAVIFGGRRDTTPKIRVIVVDEDHSRASQQLVKGLSEESLTVNTRPAPKRGVEQPEYTAASAEAAVRAGAAPVALIIPKGFGENPIAFGGGQQRSTIQLLKDSSDMVAPQVITGLLQKVAMTAMPDAMAAQGSKYMEMYAGGFTPEQRRRINQGLEELHQQESTGNGGTQSNRNSNAGMPIAVATRDVVGENKNNPMVSFYAAAIGVMFLLFTASSAGGSLLDEAESGTLDRCWQASFATVPFWHSRNWYSCLSGRGWYSS
jgi:ABC-2 type transport system permease protein